MENQREHSTAKLALAIFTSPAAAFEEINRRKLLRTGLIISAITGTLSVLPPLIACLSGERLQWLVISQYNPVAWVGLTMLYVAFMQRVLKWIGAQVDFVALLTLMGWAQLAMVLAVLATISLTVGQVTDTAALQSAGGAGIVLFSLWYVSLMGTAIRTLLNVNRARGILTYVVVHLALWIGLSLTYHNTRVSGFEGATRGILSLASFPFLSYADRLPWAGAAVAGLVIGAVALCRHFELPTPKLRQYSAGAAAVGLLLFGIWVYALHQAGYYATLRSAYIHTIGQRHLEAAADLKKLTHLTKLNGAVWLDIADLYYMAEQDNNALRYYQQSIKSINSVPAVDLHMWRAQAHNGIGNIYDLQGKHREALAQFKKASKAWPDFREPWVRMAIAYCRMGMYDQALEAADHAQKKLGSEALTAWVALGQASLHSDKSAQAKTAMAIVRDKDEKLAARMGDWRQAVDRLSRQDLRYPLERQDYPTPQRAPAGDRKTKKQADTKPDQDGRK